MPACGFTLNTQPNPIRLKMLRERREHLENTIKQMQDALYIIDCEIVEAGAP